MGSGYGSCECPICERDAFAESDINTYELTVQCFYCGYIYQEIVLCDRKREKETGELYYKLNKNGKRMYKIREHIGHGAYCIARYKGGRNIGSFIKPLTQKDIERVHNVIDSPEIDRGKSYLLSFDPTTKKLTAVFGKIPEDPMC